VREFGVALAIGVTIDATLVRLVLLPALMTLLGPRAWWAPRWIRARSAPAALPAPSSGVG
jgi:RND superfamily putative drug exporter